MRWLLLVLVMAPCWARSPEDVVRQFYQVGQNLNLKGNARWAAVRPLMTPRFYEAVRKASAWEDGGYNLKNSGIILFDMGMFQTHQRDFGECSVGPARRQGDQVLVPVRTVNRQLNNLTSQSDFILLGSGGSYQIDDIFHYYQGKRLNSYRASSWARYKQARH